MCFALVFDIFFKDIYNKSMIDLHIHTKYSDGEYDEKEIIQKVKDAGIDEFAICDHDTIEGSKRVFEELKKQNSNLKFHSGVELTSRVEGIFGGVNVHILVRDFDYDEPGINALIEDISELRRKKIARMVDYIDNAYGIRFSDEEIEGVERTTKSVGKPHMYKLLCKYGDYDREKYYRIMDGLHTEDLRLDALRILKLAHEGKGNVTLAHPIEIMREYKLEYEDIDKLVGYLKSQGLDGLEIHNSSQTRENIKEYSKIAKKYSLFETWGSDYHGEHVKPDTFLGVCQKD